MLERRRSRFDRASIIRSSSQAAKPTRDDEGAKGCHPFARYFFFAAWTSISTSMPSWTSEVIWLVMREGLLGWVAVPK